MTTSVIVKARAWGATVVASVEGSETDKVELGPNQERTFHVAPNQTVNFSVTHGAEPQPEAEPSTPAQEAAATDQRQAGGEDLED